MSIPDLNLLVTLAVLLAHRWLRGVVREVCGADDLLPAETRP